MLINVSGNFSSPKMQKKPEFLDKFGKNFPALNVAGLQHDKFEKQISFKGVGNINFDEMEEFREITENMSESEKNDFVRNIKMEVFIQDLLFKAPESAYRRYISDKYVSSILLDDFLRRDEELFGETKEVYSADVVEDGISAMLDAGIKTVRDFMLFSRAFYKPEVFKQFDSFVVEALEIYGKLKNKADFSNFPELLYFVHSDEKDEDGDFELLNTYPEFLRSLNVNNFDEFDERFAYLKPFFNGFEDIADKIDAIDYAFESHTLKMDLVAEAAKKSSLRKTPAEIYNKTYKIVDYLFEDSGGRSLESYGEILDLLFAQDKIKRNVLNRTAPHFNNFALPQDTIYFCNLLKLSGISISELNDMFASIPVKDANLVKCISLKQPMVSKISAKTGKSKAETAEFYKKFSPVLTSLYEKACLDGDRQPFSVVFDFVKIAEKYKIKNSDSFLQFYNRATGNKEKSLDADKMYDFVRLFKYAPDEDIFAATRNQNMVPVEYLKLQKANFEANKQKVVSVIKNHPETFGLSSLPLSCYLKYKNFFEENADPEEIFTKILFFDGLNSEECESRQVQLEKIAPYFETTEDAMKFVSDSASNLDNGELEAFLNSCSEIFASIASNEQDSEIAAKKIEQFLKTPFLANSRNMLADFCAKFSFAKNPHLVDLIIERNIDSAEDFEKFLDEFKSDDGSFENVLNHLKNSPLDIDFRNYRKILSNIQAAMQVFLPELKLNNDNILKVDIKKFKSGIIDARSLNALLSSLLGKSDAENFVTLLDGACKKADEKYSKYRILMEILRNSKSGCEYNNILRETGLGEALKTLNRKLPENQQLELLSGVISNEFVKMVNSDDWLVAPDEEKVPDLSLHARLRFLERFALNREGDINRLYSESTKSKLREIISSIYHTVPVDLRPGNADTMCFVVESRSEWGNLETVFARCGRMITTHFK